MLTDFSKVFVTVPHKQLVHTLNQLRIYSSIVSRMIDFLTNRAQYTKVSEFSSFETIVFFFSGQHTRAALMFNIL